MIEIDAEWRGHHPLPAAHGSVNKKSRGRVLAIGGARRTPGAIRLTAEAALRAGAGRVRIATLESAALLTGLLFPEVGMIALPEAEGEIAAGACGVLKEQAAQHQAVVLGSGMADKAAAAHLVAGLSADPPADTVLVLDAAAVACAGTLAEELQRWRGRLILTPHDGEMAAVSGRPVEEVREAVAEVATGIAARFDAVVVAKGVETLVVDPTGAMLHYPGGGTGLATGGSGDVLAGLVAGLAARGTDPLAAAGWGVWLHGEAGRAAAAKIAPLGFLAGELLPEIPPLLPR